MAKLNKSLLVSTIFNKNQNKMKPIYSDSHKERVVVHIVYQVIMKLTRSYLRLSLVDTASPRSIEGLCGQDSRSSRLCEQPQQWFLAISHPWGDSSTDSILLTSESLDSGLKVWCFLAFSITGIILKIFLNLG